MLISFEGLDGSGKSTQAEKLRSRLEAQGHSVLLLREPGGTEVSEHIRALLLDPNLDITPFAELLLFSAARAQLVQERIRPALQRGMWVVLDRFFDSTTAYQGGGRAVASVEWLEGFHRHVTGGLVPHRTYLLQVDGETARHRRTHRGASDRMELGGEGFYEKTARAYEELAAREPSRFRVLNGALRPEALHDLVWADLQAALTGTAP